MRRCRQMDMKQKCKGFHKGAVLEVETVVKKAEKKRRRKRNLYKYIKARKSRSVFSDNKLGLLGSAL